MKYLIEQTIIVKVFESKTVFFTDSIVVFLGYNNRFKRSLQKSHPNIWLFMDSIRKEVHTIHDLIQQINSGMPPRTKRSQTRIAEQRMKELYDRFNQNKITVQELLRSLSFYVANQK